MNSQSPTSTSAERRRHFRFGLVIAGFSIFAATGFVVASCSFVGGPVSGPVLDADTGKPIADAIVVVSWASDPIGPWAPTICFHIETATSDRDGYYQVPMWWNTPPALMLGSARVSDAYSANYEAVHSHTPEAKARPDDVYMKRFAGSDGERLEYIRSRVFSGMSCLGAGASRRNLFVLHRAAIHEAKRLIVSAEQAKIIDGLRIVAADDWLAATSTYRETFLDPLANVPPPIRRELE